MKKWICIGLFLIGTCSVQAQDLVSDFLAKTKENKVFTQVNISSRMFQMISEITDAETESIIRNLTVIIGDIGIAGILVGISGVFDRINLIRYKRHHNIVKEYACIAGGAQRDPLCMSNKGVFDLLPFALIESYGFDKLNARIGIVNIRPVFVNK